MGYNKIQGTPWHVGYVLKKEEDQKHDKRSCEYYLGNDECEKKGRCIGGRYCLEYLRKPKRSKKQLEYRAKEIEDARNFENVIVTYEYNYIGYFTVKFLDDDDIVKFAIGETKERAKNMGAQLITKDKPLFKKVLATQENREFEIEGTKILLLEKKINRYEIK